MSVRIGAGRLKGRRLPVPGSVRPTGSKVRAALFDILGPEVEGASFLDLFAGSGAVGVEAWSRGAERIVLVEGDRRSAGRLARTVEALCGEDGSIVHARLPERWERVRAHGPWDIVFADPPYAFQRFAELMECVAPSVRPGGLVCVEHAAGADLPARVTGLGGVSERRYGESRLAFYEPEGSDAARAESGSKSPSAAEK